MLEAYGRAERGVKFLPIYTGTKKIYVFCKKPIVVKLTKCFGKMNGVVKFFSVTAQPLAVVYVFYFTQR